MKRLFIPRTPMEAERTLWHAIDHIKTGDHSYEESEDATELLREVICDLGND